MKYLYLLLLVSFVSFAGCTTGKDTGDAEAAGSDSLGQTAAAAETASDYESGAWITDYDLALQYAQELDRPVLINFTGSDWCSWCIKLKNEVFTQDAWQKYAQDNLVLLTVDFPNKKKLPPAEQAANQALAEKYEIEGFPTIVLVDAAGKELARTGYQYGGPEKYVQHVQELLSDK